MNQVLSDIDTVFNVIAAIPIPALNQYTSRVRLIYAGTQMVFGIIFSVVGVMGQSCLKDRVWKIITHDSAHLALHGILNACRASSEEFLIQERLRSKIGIAVLLGLGSRFLPLYAYNFSH